jgi:hypothetical protein
MSRRQITSTARARTIPESKAHASSMAEARRAMELSRQRMYADRSKRNRTIMLYTTGSVSFAPLLLVSDRDHTAARLGEWVWSLRAVRHRIDGTLAPSRLCRGIGSRPARGACWHSGMMVETWIAWSREGHHKGPRRKASGIEGAHLMAVGGTAKIRMDARLVLPAKELGSAGGAPGNGSGSLDRVDMERTSPGFTASCAWQGDVHS